MNYTLWIIGICLIILLLVLAYLNYKASIIVYPVRKIGNTTARDEVSKGMFDRIIDVHVNNEDPDSYHFPGSVNIPLNSIMDKNSPVRFYELNARILVLCNNPKCARDGAIKLYKMGFLNVSYLNEEYSYIIPQEASEYNTARRSYGL